jgi:cell division protein FtsW
MRRTLRIYDPWLFGLSVLATLAGMFFIFDAGYPQAIAGERTFLPPEFRSQVLVGALSILLGVFASRITPARWKRMGVGIAVIVLVALVLVMKFGSVRYGARRWIVGIQPAEFAKLAVVLYLASTFADRALWPKSIPRRADIAQWLDTIAVPKVRRFLPALWVLLGAAIIEKEPDMGTAAVVAVVAFLMFIPGGVSWKSILAVLVIGGVGGYGLVKSQSYRMGRILNHSHRWEPANAVSTTYQTDQAELAVATGGVIGVGVGNGQAKQVIPAATTDFVMVTVGEETGLFGSLLLLTLLGAIVWRLYWQASRVTDRYAMLVLVGVASWIGVQTCVNFMMANGFLPAIGIPLPFISAGGSSLAALWLALGVCQSALAPASDTAEEKTIASSRHRRRYRRARLSRA